MLPARQCRGWVISTSSTVWPCQFVSVSSRKGPETGGQAGLFHAIGDVIAGVAIGRFKIVGMLLCGERDSAHAGVPEIAVPAEVLETGVFEAHGFEDGVPDIAVVGMWVGALEVSKHRSFIGMRARVSIFCRQLLHRQGAIDRNFFRRRAALERVKARLAPRQQEGRVQQRQFCRFRNDLVGLRHSLV